MSGQPGRAPAQTAAATRYAATTLQRVAAYTRICSAQPSGEAQLSHETPEAESPTARSRNATPAAATASPRAVRALTVSWAQIAATAANTQPDSPTAVPRASEPASG